MHQELEQPTTARVSDHFAPPRCHDVCVISDSPAAAGNESRLMPHRRLLDQIQQILRAPSAHIQSLKAGLKGRRIKVAATPMTDQELARAIREFQAPDSKSRRQVGDGSGGN
jgi:hypothetical protein